MFWTCCSTELLFVFVVLPAETVFPSVDVFVFVVGSTPKKLDTPSTKPLKDGKFWVIQPNKSPRTPFAESTKSEIAPRMSMPNASWKMRLMSCTTLSTVSFSDSKAPAVSPLMILR